MWIYQSVSNIACLQKTTSSACDHEQTWTRGLHGGLLRSNDMTVDSDHHMIRLVCKSPTLTPPLRYPTFCAINSKTDLTTKPTP